MKLYRLKLNPDTRPEWHATKQSAQQSGRSIESAYRKEVRICEVSIPTQKDDVITILNGSLPPALEVSRTWAMTARGGLTLTTAES